MRRLFWLMVALAAAAPLAPAAADGMIEDGYHGDVRRPALRGHHRYGMPRRGRTYVGGHRRAWAEVAPHYGAHPPFFAGAGRAAPAGPVLLAEYSEPYIGRGLIYNVPPDPILGSAYVVRAKY